MSEIMKFDKADSIKLHIIKSLSVNFILKIDGRKHAYDDIDTSRISSAGFGFTYHCIILRLQK